MSSLIPVHAAGSIVEGITEYLTTSFSLADNQVAEELKRFLSADDSGMFHGPYLRARLPYAQATDWKGVLEWLPERFVPYHHQKAAFERLRSRDSYGSRRPDPTLVVTGTGSGKTESFLYPILDHARRTRAQGQSGVKAILLYPMNALANDQADRLAKLIHANPALKGVTAGLYTGEAKGNRSTMGADALINDRDAMRADPPDLLLTNYKMLDRLLLQSADRAIWEKSATSLQYLALDEFHTYDGAQGTDVALLLRRLGLMLKEHQPDGFLDQLAATRPLGQITPVATSATLGSKDEPSAILEFAYTIFGEQFTNDTVISETMLSLEQWRLEVADRFGNPDSIYANFDMPTAEEIEIVLKKIAEIPQGTEYPDHCVNVFAETIWRCDADLDSAIQHYAHHELTAAILEHASTTVPLTRREQDEQSPLPELVLGSTARIVGEAKAEEFLTHALTAMAQLRARYGERDAWGGKRLPGVETHLWVREVSRIDRALGAGDSDSVFRWSDDGTSDDDSAHWLPACYCRSCGRSGWMTSLEQGTDAPIMNEQEIRKNSMEHARRQRPLLDATAEQRAAIKAGRDVVGPRSSGDHSSVLWMHASNRELSSRRPTAAEEESGSSIPVLTLIGRDADDLAEQQVCPSCGDRDSIRYLGSSVSTLLSVSLSNLFGMPDLEAREKKTLVFADAVQDAAHRAGFVQARARSFALRTYTRAAAGQEETTLAALAGRLIERTDSNRSRYELLPPDLMDLDLFRGFWHADANDSERREAVRQVLKRLSFDLALEFGQRADLPRSLALTGALSVYVDLPKAAALTAAAEALGTVEAPTMGLSDKNLQLSWVQGVLEMLRFRGGINHDWLRAYLRTDGNAYMLNRRQSRAEGVPGFPKGGSPEFPRIGPALTGAARNSTGTTPLGGARGRFALWTSRVLGLSSHDAATAVTKLFDALRHRGILASISTDTGGTIYGLDQDRVRIVSEKHPGNLECDVCHAKTGVHEHIRTLLDQAPCFTPGCSGVLHVEAIEDNYYRRLYSTTQPRTVIAREHTGLLEKDVRLGLERSFRGNADDPDASPDAPNVLVATPTLEMGIDIGDLSTVMLASLPTSVASYVQRVGRAGRLSGNSLVLAIVRGRGLSLPRLNQPLSMINGSVTPPVAYLSAVEILHRQFLAYLIDTLDISENLPRLKSAVDVYDDTGGKASLVGVIKQQLQQGITGILESFSKTVSNHVSFESLVELREWAIGESTESLIGRLTSAQADWKEERHSLTARRVKLSAVLDELDARDDEHDEDLKEEKRKASASLRAIRRQLREAINDQDWINSMERFGLLPNFTLLDDTVELNVAVTTFNPLELRFDTTPFTYSRGLSQALHELAPGATFYAQGIAATIDTVEIGDAGANIEQWRVCPVCSHSQIGANNVGPCPSCGSPAFADKGQVLDVVPMRRVSSEVEKTRASISDNNDDRFSARFQQHVSYVVPDGGHGRSWFLSDGFGIEHLPKVDLRWLNLGKGNGEKRWMGNHEISSPLFRVCRHCGHVDSEAGSNSKWDHRPWCTHRYEIEEDTVTFALGRTLRTQGVLMFLPERFGAEADSLTVTSLIAAIKLGFREVLGGDPEHLDVSGMQVPRPTGSGAIDALMLHDQVPGGTGYLDQFADPKAVRSLIERAWERVSNCDCQYDDRLACPDCLLPYARTSQLPITSRAAAERALRSILLDDSVLKELADISEAPAWTTHENRPEAPEGSQLELRFRVLLRKALQNRRATIEDKDVAGKPAMTIEMSSGVRWRMQEQVDFGYTRPDFYFEPLNGKHRPVAVFTDGAAFHISEKHWGVHNDIQRRTGLTLEDDHVLPWNLTSLDLDRFTSPENHAKKPAWFTKKGQKKAAESNLLSQTDIELLENNAFEQLLGYLHDPAAKSWSEFAHASAQHLLTISPKRVGDQVEAPLGEQISLVVSIVGRQFRARTLRLNPVLPGELNVETWTTFLNLANLMWLSPDGLEVVTSEEVEINVRQAKPDIVVPEESLAIVIPQAWQEVLDDFDDEEDVLEGLRLLTENNVLPPENFGEEWENLSTVAMWPTQKIVLLFTGPEGEESSVEDNLQSEGWTFLYADSLEVSDIPKSLIH